MTDNAARILSNREHCRLYIKDHLLLKKQVIHDRCQGNIACIRGVAGLLYGRHVLTPCGVLPVRLIEAVFRGES